MPGFTLSDQIAIIGILVMIVSSYLSHRDSRGVSKEQLKNERKNIAKAIDTDLKNISKYTHFSEYYENHKNDDLDKEESFLLHDYDVPENLYNENTFLYFGFKNNITKLKNDISKEINEFYNDLFKAEEFRKIVKENQYLDPTTIQANPDFYDSIFEKAKEMKALIVKCGDRISELRKKLKEVYEF